MNRKSGWILISLGLLLLAAALFLCLYNMWEVNAAQQSVDAVLEQGMLPLAAVTADRQTTEETAPEPTEEYVEIPDYILNPEMELPVQTIGQWDYIGTLEIPVLELTLPIISDWNYEALRTAPCRYDGSPYMDNLILCAHNYATHFGGLNNLIPGDQIFFTDVDGNTFTYTVAVLEILQPTAIEEMYSDDWALSLFTCTLGGRTRFTVRCDRADQEY